MMPRSEFLESQLASKFTVQMAKGILLRIFAKASPEIMCVT